MKLNNSLKSKSANHKICRILFLFLILVTNLLSPLAATAYSANWQEDMLQRVNKIRIENGVPALQTCKTLQLAAQRYSDYMATENFLSHTGKDGSSVGDRLMKAGFLWKNSKSPSYIGENIAAGQKTVQEVVKSWTKSRSHFKNMISKNFTHAGFGMSKSTKSSYGIYWVQNFGSGVRC
jgi:uncharacterized protein YkwD